MGDLEGAKGIFGGCPHDCPDTCSMIYHVKDGALVGVGGNPDHPYTRGGLCAKLKDFDQHHRNPERVLYPMKRAGAKGEGRFKRITWHEALSTIKQRWSAIIDAYGAEAILPYNYLGNQGTLQGLNVGDAFFNRLGASVCEKTFCGSGSSTAYLMTVGPTGGVDPESFIHSRFIVLWACNAVSTHLHHWHVIREAQKRGARVVVIDVFRSRTAKLADWHIAPRPGTDGALAMALIHTLISEDLIDAEYVRDHTVGFEELKERAANKTPEWAEDITGVSASEIRRLARELATTKPSVIRIGVALERHAGGGQAVRAVCCISALTGSWREVGGGLLQMPIWEFPINWARVCRPEWIRPGTRVVNTLQLGQALTGGLGLDPPIQSLMVYNANPATQAPETDRIIQGFRREDLFLVVSEHFITDTAAYADILLPATMAAEHEDIMYSWGHFHLTYNQKAIDAPGETLPNTELFRRLAREFGFDDVQFTRNDREMIEHYLDWDAPQMQGITMQKLRENGYTRLNVGSSDERCPHREGNFPTASGKVEFLSSLATAGNFVGPVFRQLYDDMQGREVVDPLPDYVPNAETADPELAERYPLSIVSPKSHAFLNSCYANEPHKQKLQGEQYVLISPADASMRAIQEGDTVRVFNDRGDYSAVARVSNGVNSGLVVTPLGYWRKLNRDDGSVNSVSTSRYANLGHAPTFSDNLVEIVRLKRSMA